MPTYHVESNGQQFEIDAPDEATALRVFKSHGVGSVEGNGKGETPSAMAASSSAPAASSPSPALHWPAMLGQSFLNGMSAVPNALISGFNWANQKEPVLSYKGEGGGVVPAQMPSIPQVDLGAIAKPEGTIENLAAAGAGGVGSLVTPGAGVKVPAMLESTGSQILRALPAMAKDAFVRGAVPAGAVEGVHENVSALDSLPPAMRGTVDALLGATAAIASHHFLGGDAVESVAGRLGKSLNSDEAGNVAKKATLEWRKSLGDKIEENKGTTYGAAGEDNHDTLLFGKVPMSEAKIDNIETMKTLGQLSGKGGVYKDVLHSFGEDMPPRMKDLLTNIAKREGPIEDFGPKVTPQEGVKSAGPVDETSPQMVRPGPVPPYGPTSPLRNDSFQAVVPTGGQKGEVGFHLQEPEGAQGGIPQSGTIVGFPSSLHDAMELRSWIGEQTARGMMPKGSTPAQWDALYKALTADISKTMEKYGAGEEWKNYNIQTTKLYEAGNRLSRFANDDNSGKDSAKAGNEVQRIWNGMRKDSSDIQMIREQMPQVADEIAAGFIRQHPEQWHGLPRDTREALVPNPFDRLALDNHAIQRPSITEMTKERNKSDLAAKLGLGAGAAFDMYAHNATAGSTNILVPMAAAAGASVVPSLVKSLRDVPKNYKMLAVPAAGGIAGGVSQEGKSPSLSGSVGSSPLLK